MSDCDYCPVESECHYPYKPCDCVGQRKFWSKEKADAVQRQNEPRQHPTSEGDAEVGDE